MTISLIIYKKINDMDIIAVIVIAMVSICFWIIKITEDEDENNK